MTGDKARPQVKVMLDRERTLVLDLNAMAAYCEATGKSFLRGEVDMAKINEVELRALLWACLLTDDPGLTREQVGAMVNVGNMPGVAAKLFQAVTNSLPESEAAGGKAPLSESQQPG